MSAASSVSDSLLHICSNSSSCHNVFILSLFIRCDKPELTRWCLCSLHAGIQMSSDEVVGSRDGCRHSITESTVDVSIRLFLQIISAHTIISRLVCLQGTRGSFEYFPMNVLHSFCRNMKSAVHVPYAGWLILPCSALARTHFKNFLSSIQVFCCKTFTML